MSYYRAASYARSARREQRLKGRHGRMYVTEYDLYLREQARLQMERQHGLSWYDIPETDRRKMVADLAEQMRGQGGQDLAGTQLDPAF